MKNKRGFSLVELLAVITIMGILAVISIVGVNYLLQKFRINYYKAQEDNMVIAGTDYFDTVDNVKPKSSGQLNQVQLSTLIDNKYIDKIIDYHKDNCDYDKSYVQIFKYDGKYYYTPYLQCSNDHYKTDIYSYESNLKVNIDMSNSFSNPKASITISDNKAYIASYQYYIYKDNKLIYTSEVIEGKKKETINKSLSLNKYIPGGIKVKVTATNTRGISKTVSASYKYIDEAGPTCKKVNNSSTTWTNKNREITIDCDDGIGIGCARGQYSQTFNTDTKTANIEIYDKLNNRTICRNINVYVDKTKPKLTYTIYKTKSDGTKGTKLISNTIDSDTTLNLDSSILSDTYNNWLNYSNYRYGLYVVVSAVDPTINDAMSGIKSLEWTLNDTGYTSTSDNGYKNKKTSGKADNSSGSEKASVEYKISGDGLRYSTITVSDVATNKVTLTITASMDTSRPTLEAIAYKRDSSGNATGASVGSAKSTGGTASLVSYKNTGNNGWLNKNGYPNGISYKISGSDNIKLTKWKWEYNVEGLTNDSDFTYAGENTYTLNKKSFESAIQITNSGHRKSNIILTDQAGNTSTINISVYLDNISPTCTIQSSNNNWTNSNVYTSAKCSDSGGSLCEKELYERNISYTAEYYDYTVSDNAGNTASCRASAFVDKTPPTTPNSGSMPAVSGSNSYADAGSVSGSSDGQSGFSHYLYCIKTNSSTPSNTDSCFTTNTGYYRACGQTNYAWAIAVDRVGNRSGVYSMGSTSDHAYEWGSCSSSCEGTQRNLCELETGTQACGGSCVHTYTKLCGRKEIPAYYFYCQGNKHPGKHHTTAYILYYRDDITGQLYVKGENLKKQSPIASEVIVDSSIAKDSYCCPEFPPFERLNEG